MKADKAIAIYQEMRGSPFWQLLASDNGPVTLALLQTLLYDTDKTLSASIFYERIGQELEGLRAKGEDFSRRPQEYAAEWLRSGWLVRRFPAGAAEEVYELSIATVRAIRFVSNAAQPRAAATESRLSLVVGELVRLAEDTDANKARRIEALKKDREQIDQKIAEIEAGRLHMLTDAQANERLLNIISLAEELPADFLRVRDEFESLNQRLRRDIIEGDEKRGKVLEELFNNVDLIAESDAGRTWVAFWNLLNEPVESETLNTAIEDVLSRGFVSSLSADDRKFLQSMVHTLLQQGGLVQENMRYFAQSLRRFVESQEYLEQQRIGALLKDARRTALEMKDRVRAQTPLNFSLALTGAHLDSISRLALFDPSLRVAPLAMGEGDKATLSLEAISSLVAQSEIDFRSLRENIHAVLEKRGQTSIAGVLEAYPAAQGLGSVVGLLAIGAQEGFRTGNVEKVCWLGENGVHRAATIPQIFFHREGENG